MNDNDRIAPKDLHKYEPVTRHLGDKMAGVTFYAERGQPILKIIDSLAEVKRYKIRDFYKPELIEQALTEVLKSRGLETVATKDLRQAIKHKSGLIPKNDRYAKMVASLQANTEAVADYFSTYLDSYLVETLKPTLKTEQEGGKSTDELLSGTETKRLIPLTDGVYTSKNGSKTKQQGYTVPDQKALEQFIKGLLATDHKERKIGTISESELQQGSTSLESYGDRYKAIRTLGEASGINLGEQPEQDKGTITINTAYITLEGILHKTLYQMVQITKAKPEGVDNGAGREAVNILSPEQHRYIGRPTTMGLLDMITKTIDGKDLADLKEQYIDRDSRKDGGGFLTHVSDPQTALPFDITDVGLDANQKAKLVGNVVALTIQAVGALQAYKRDNPDNDGYIKIKDLAKYIGKYSDDMANNKGWLRPQYRQAILNGLTLATLAGDSYIISKDKKTGKARHGVVYLIDRITEYETNKKGDIIAVKTDFTQEYKASLQYNLGVLTDGVERLKSPEAINLATYISDRQVAEQDKTVTGKPITFTAETLCKKASIVDKHVTKRYGTLTDLLNELKAEGVAIGRWATKSKATTITGYDKESQTIYIYPTKTAQNTYTTRERTKAARNAYRLEQEARVKALNKYAKGYTNLDVLAKEMGITRPELEGLLAGQQRITGNHLAKIDLDL